MDIDYLRKEINALDSKIVDLLNKRAKIVLKIGEIKKQKQTQIYVPNREQEVYSRIKSQNKGPLTDECLVAIYRELMAGSLVLEKAIKVSYLGPEGTFSYFAAKQKFGSSVEYVPARGIDDVFRDVAGGRSDYGIVPVENSTEGGIRETLNMFVEFASKSGNEGQYYAVIANAEIAQLYGLNILFKNIEDNPSNITRFFVLSKDYGAPSGRDRTAVM